MKRLVLVALLLFVGVASVAAQEGGAEKAEPNTIWKWANFLILAGVIGYVCAKQLPPLFRARTASIQKGILEAQAMKREAEARAAAMDARLAALGVEIEKLRTESQVEMQQEGERIRQETARQMERLRDQVEQDLQAAAKTARRELKAYGAALALQLAEQRVKARLNPETENVLVDGFVIDLQKQESKN